MKVILKIESLDEKHTSFFYQTYLEVYGMALVRAEELIGEKILSGTELINYLWEITKDNYKKDGLGNKLKAILLHIGEKIKCDERYRIEVRWGD